MKAVGVTLIIIGVLGFTGYLLYLLLIIPDFPWVLKGALFAVALGTLLLIGALIKERLSERGEEKDDLGNY